MVICDAGFPILNNMKRIDLSLIPGVPGFIQTLAALTEEIDVERIILAEEIKQDNPEMLKEIERLLKGVAIEFVSHGEFKKKVQEAKSVVRTGEVTPYSNIILVSGVQTLFAGWLKNRI